MRQKMLERMRSSGSVLACTRWDSEMKIAVGHSKSSCGWEGRNGNETTDSWCWIPSCEQVGPDIMRAADMKEMVIVNV